MLPIVLALGLPALAGPTTQVAPTDTAPAVAAAKTWLQTIDTGDYEASWDNAASSFRQAVWKNEWWSILNAVRKPLGAVQSRRMTSAVPTTTVPGGPDGQYVILKFETAFANKAQAIETVTPVLDTDGAWRVSGYVIK